MPKFDTMTPGEILADVSVADFVRELAMGIADAQAALTKNSVDEFIRLAREPIVGLGKTAIELGLSPPFYHFQYADLEMKVHLCMRLSKDFGFGLDAAYGQGNAAAQSQSSTSTDSLTVTVIQGDGAPATGVILLRSNALGSVHIGDADFAVVAGTATGVDVELEPSLYGTGLHLAKSIVNNSGSSKVSRIEMDVVYGSPAVAPTTNVPTALVCGPNRVNVDWTGAAGPARAWFDIKTSPTSTGPLELSFISTSGGGGGTSALTSVTQSTTASDPLGQLVTDIVDAQNPADYKAFVLARDGRAPFPIYFDFADDTPKQDANNARVIDRFAAFLIANSQVRVDLVGNTDPVGGDTDNERLSNRRAASVADWLKDKGVPSSQITFSGAGERDLVSNGDHDTANHWKDRRVEIHVTTGQDNIIGVETVTLGVEWGAKTIDAGLGALLKAIDGGAGNTLADGDWVKVGPVKLLVGPSPAHFEKSISPIETAANLAQAICDHVPNHTAFTFDTLVHIQGPGSLIRLTMVTEAQSAAANQTKLEGATGSIAIARGFSGGADAADPNAGDTVSFGNVTLTCLDIGDTPAADQFCEGANAAETATNLGEAISHFGGLSAAVSGNVVTVTAPSGTSASTLNPRAFRLSSGRFGNRTESYDASQARATAFSASADLHYDRKYDVSVNAMSTIKARMVAIPAPVEFLDEIRTYLLTWR